jgi:hypothetical protein
MAIASGQTLGTALCEALGIDASRVLSLHLQCDANNIAKLIVESAVDITAVSGVKFAVAMYDLHLAESADVEPAELW